MVQFRASCFVPKDFFAHLVHCCLCVCIWIYTVCSCICVHVCIRVVQSSMCVTRPAGRPFADSWDSLGFLQSATHSEHAVKNTSFLNRHERTVQLCGALFIYIVYKDNCAFLNFSEGKEQIVNIRVSNLWPPCHKGYSAERSLACRPQAVISQQHAVKLKILCAVSNKILSNSG